MARNRLAPVFLVLLLLTAVSPRSASAAWTDSCAQAFKNLLKKIGLKKAPPAPPGSAAAGTEQGAVAVEDAARSEGTALRPLGELRPPNPLLPEKYKETLLATRAKLNEWARQFSMTPLRLSMNIPAGQRHFVELAAKMMRDPQRFARWLGDLVEEAGLEMANHPSAHVRQLAAEGKIDRGALLRVLRKRSRDLGFGDIKIIKGNVRNTPGSKAVTGFDAATKNGTVFFDMPFRRGAHGRDFHLLQVLYVSGEAAAGEGPAFMKWVGERGGARAWDTVFDAFDGTLSHPEHSNPLLRKILPFE